MKKYDPIKEDNQIYKQCIHTLTSRVKVWGGVDKHPPASEKCFNNAKRIMDLIFQVHPELYKGTNHKEGRHKQLEFYHGETHILVEYMDWGLTTHEFKCLTDGSIKYTQLLHGDQHENEHYEEEYADGEITDVILRRHIRRRGWPTETVKNAA